MWVDMKGETPKKTHPTKILLQNKIARRKLMKTLVESPSPINSLFFGFIMAEDIQNQKNNTT